MKNIEKKLYQIRKEINNGIKANDLPSRVWDPTSKTYEIAEEIGEPKVFPFLSVILPSSDYNLNQPVLYA